MHRSLLILPLAALAWIAGAGAAHAQLTTLYSNLEGPRTVTTTGAGLRPSPCTGIDDAAPASHAVAPLGKRQKNKLESTADSHHET